MDDDIVTRLRGMACPECGLPSTHNHFEEAADEIERLQADRDRWKALAIHNDNLAQIQAGIYPVIPHYEEK